MIPYPLKKSLEQTKSRFQDIEMRVESESIFHTIYINSQKTHRICATELDIIDQTIYRSDRPIFNSSKSEDPEEKPTIVQNDYSGLFRHLIEHMTKSLPHDEILIALRDSAIITREIETSTGTITAHEALLNSQDDDPIIAVLKFDEDLLYYPSNLFAPEWLRTAY